MRRRARASSRAAPRARSAPARRAALSSLKPPAPRSPASTGRRNSSVSRILRQRLLERDPVPALDDHVRRGAETENEAPVRRVGERRRLLRERRTPARVGVDDPGGEADPLGVSGREHQRREAVGAGRVAGPEVVVAELLGEPEVRRVVVQREAGERERQAPAGVRGHEREPYGDTENPPSPAAADEMIAGAVEQIEGIAGADLVLGRPFPAARAGAPARPLDRRGGARRRRRDRVEPRRHACRDARPRGALRGRGPAAAARAAPAVVRARGRGPRDRGAHADGRRWRRPRNRCARSASSRGSAAASTCGSPRRGRGSSRSCSRWPPRSTRDRAPRRVTACRG